MTRLLGAADACAADAIVRITGDCPLVDPGVVGQVVQAYRDHAAATDYVCNIWPRSFPHGLDTEIYPRETLRRLEVEVPRGAARETFARYVWEHAPEFRLLNVASARPLAHWRWTVDYPEDLAFVRAVYRRLYRPERPFLMADVLRLLAEEPALANLNAGRLGDTEAAAAQSAVRPLLGTAP